MKAAAANTRAKKRRRTTEGSRRRQKPRPGSGRERVEGVNLFSRLTDDLLCETISFLPTKDGARTRILASPWRHLWLSAPLNLDQGSLLPRRNVVDGLFSEILAAHGGPVRRLSITTLARIPGVEDWLQSPAFDRLQELEFDDGGLNYIPDTRPLLWWLPAAALRLSATLRVVTITSFKFPNGGEALRFPRLEMLGLERVRISEASLHGLIAGSPVLDSLLLKNNVGFDSVRINSPTLTSFGLATSCVHQRLVVEDAPLLQRLILPGRRADGLRVSVISAPKLETLGPIHSFLPALPQEYGAFSFTAVMHRVRIVAINIFSLSIDWVIKLMMVFLP